MRFILFVAGLLAAFLPGTGLAHDARPIAVEILQQDDAFVYQTRVRTPDALQSGPTLAFPDACRADFPAARRQIPGSVIEQQLFHCANTIQGQLIGLTFRSPNPSLSVLIRVELDEGASFSAILPPGVESWAVPVQEAAATIAFEYTWLGIKHIWLGVDHLLFVLCLLFIAGGREDRRWRRILITITGFTVAHSITLVAAALELVLLPVPAVEAVIALSILFLAVEIMRQNEDSWTYRFPVAVAVSFGLLHGFGFAAVLQEIGLPQAELPIALFTFNIGVEIGQIVFLVAVLAIATLFRDIGTERIVLVRVLSGYFVGSVSAYWLIDRTLSFWIVT